MRKNEPTGVEALPQALISVPGTPDDCRGRLVERDRLEWRCGDGGDPAALAQEFLTGHGVAVADLGRPARHDPDGVCGAALYLSAAAGALLAGGAPAAATPVPALPDLVVVVYTHTDRHRPPEAHQAATPAAGLGTLAGPATAARRPDPAQRWWLGRWRESWTPGQHADAVEAVRAAIGRGDVYQVNLVGHAAAPYAGDPLPALARLGALPGARYGGTLSGLDWAIGCASPETLVEVDGGRLVTRPIKGTRPATAAGRRELLASAKERAEHVMIVDLERNDLARVARTGSVRVDELFAVRRWCDLWQAESTVSAAAADGLGLAELLRAVCPGGSVTGAPKLAALDRIAALEPVGRGASMGAFGWVGSGRIDLGLTIRTAAADADRLHVWAGGGITWGSDPAAEVAEAAAKAAPVRALLAAG
ncbi:para-aminobenzoate synthetase component 1 [Micromonospora kangleipakensis]|uniref:Para-aminobenzoate synthetase component 1 n=1 Tax=Micromonospora kangleipakensis TaxID=1077942 RepID=A0A4Q8BDN1_9ACTN|nr:chorismate-binding protein [Micromonospora kangleipakensis]RZU75778.1 para-aminobenzoate synthetase component 1 [Micromonospora kangleipakensis]